MIKRLAFAALTMTACAKPEPLPPTDLLQFRWAGGTTATQGAQVVAADLGSSAVDVYIGGAYTVA